MLLYAKVVQNNSIILTETFIGLSYLTNTLLKKKITIDSTKYKSLTPLQFGTKALVHNIIFPTVHLTGSSSVGVCHLEYIYAKK